MSKGTIIYVGGFELPDKNAAAHRVLSNGKILRSLGYNVVFVGINKTIPQSGSFVKEESIQGFQNFSIPYPNSQIKWAGYISKISYLKNIIDLHSDTKMIVAYNYPALALHKIKKYANKKNIKIVADCTEWYGVENKNLIFRTIKELDIFLRMRFIHKKLDGLIVISKYLEEYYRKCCNVVRIPPLVDLNESKWENSIVKSDDGKCLTLTYAGNPGVNKDKIFMIIDALFELKEYENFKLNVVGLSHEQFLETFPFYHHKLDILGERVSFRGKLSHMESLKILRDSDYSIFIRDKSRLTMAGFPTKFIESISSSTPVITNETSDIKEYFFDETYGYLIENDVNSLVEVLGKEIVKRTKNNSEKKVSNNKIFHYENYKDKVKRFIENI